VPQEHDSDKESSDSDKEEKDSSSSDNTEVGFEIEKELREEAQEYLLEQILSESGRKKFLRWLFKVADSTHDGTVSVSELTQLIKALRLDGILPEALCFAPDRCKSMVGSPDERLAKELIREYDYENSGSLSQDEFEALGELILKNYQIRQETPVRCDLFVLFF
jgi:Ca2+-binding EF-hand superfamily protein